MTGPTRRETVAFLAAGAAWLRSPAVLAQPLQPTLPAVPADIAAIDVACAPILSLLPEAAVTAGLPEAAAGGSLAGKCNDWTAAGADALKLAITAARTGVNKASGQGAAEVIALLDAASLTRDIGYGRNTPLGATHRPYQATAFSGAHLSTPASLRLVQRLDTPADVDAWQARLEAYAAALLAVAGALRSDEAAGCVPPATTSRAALPQMDAFVQAAPEQHPLVLALAGRTAWLDPAARQKATDRAAATLRQHVQPAMALLRDTLATLTRKGRSEISVSAQPDGERLYVANLARAGDTALSPADAQAIGRVEAARVAALLDRKLATRGLRTGTLADRVAAAFAAHPEFIESDDEGGRASLLQAAQARLDAARAILPRLVPHREPFTEGWPTSLALHPVPDGGKSALGGSLYLPAAIDGKRPAALWLDTRSVHALPTPGIGPIACHLGIPGLHLLASASSASRPTIARMAAFPAMAEGWGCYAEQLAAEQGLFARDPWGDMARLSDELLRAARLVVDVGIHAQRWTREQAEAEMQSMTGAPQVAAIDRIIALPGEAASYTLGLHHLLDLRDRARKKAGKAFDLRTFHAAILTGGARPFATLDPLV